MKLTEAFLSVALIVSSVWAVMERQSRFDNEATLRAEVSRRQEAESTFDRWSEMYKEACDRASANLALANEYKAAYNNAISRVPAGK